MTCHVPQFLTRWGTFRHCTPSCIMVWRAVGVQHNASMRALKAHIKLSTHGQWKGAKVGFAQVLVYSVVAWAVLRLGIKLVGRTTSPTKTKTALFDDCCDHIPLATMCEYFQDRSTGLCKLTTWGHFNHQPFSLDRFVPL